MDLETLRLHYRDQILALAEKHRLSNVRVFGSVARGEAGPQSDLDLLYHGMPGCRPLTFTKELETLLSPTDIDLVEDDSLHRLLAPYILRDATPL